MPVTEWVDCLIWEQPANISCILKKMVCRAFLYAGYGMSELHILSKYMHGMMAWAYPLIKVAFNRYGTAIR